MIIASGDKALRVGIQLPEVEREVRWAELASMATLAEDVGFDSLWVGDHLPYRYEHGFTIGGARQRLSGEESKVDVNQSQQTIRQLLTELEDVLLILKR